MSGGSNSGIPRFLIIGTPRSGTTLIQRLASELPGVKVPPETKFFVRFYPHVFHWQFPLAGAALTEAVGEYASYRWMRDAQIDVARVVQRLGGNAEGPVELFGAVVEELAGGGAEVYGEKTPGHLQWCLALARVSPWLKVVAAVRDPRAVVASRLEAPWRPQRRDWYALAAEKWKLDQEVIAKAVDDLGPERCLVLHYERVVADPDWARTAIAGLLGLEGGAEPQKSPNPGELYFPWEEFWKARAVGEITTDRVRAWEKKLPRRKARRIEALCRDGMIRFGYPTELGPLRARVERVTLSPRTNIARHNAVSSYRRELARVEGTKLF
jgi:hypothetical protein